MEQSPNFNALAKTYDADFTLTKIGMLQRKRVWKHLHKYLNKNKPQHILEINCGTGYDALLLAKHCPYVLATDIAEEMIAVCKQKTTSQQPLFEVCGFNNLVARYGNQKFDILFSNFAGLNCVDEKELEQLQADFASLLKPNGKVIAVFLGKHCFIEKWYFTWKGQKEKANRRNKTTIANLNSKANQTTTCYSTNEVETIFKQFKIDVTKPIGLFIPPSYLEPLLNKYWFVIPLIKLGEYIFGSRSMFSNHADHVYMEMKKK